MSGRTSRTSLASRCIPLKKSKVLLMKENIWLYPESLFKSETKNVNCRLLFDYLTNGVRVVGHPPSSRAFSATETETILD